MTAAAIIDYTALHLDALRTSAGLLPLATSMGESGWIAVTGSDRVRWLNGMVTNSVQALAPGEGAYSYFLNAQGRIQGDCTVWAEADRLLLQTSAAQVVPMLALLERFIIMDDVELQNLTGAIHGLLLAGPRAVEQLQAIGITARVSKILQRHVLEHKGSTCTLINAYSPLVPRFELWFASGTERAIVSQELLTRGVQPCGPAAFELLRIAEGTPRYGTDIRERDLPQETNQARALHFTKGCYLGQEIVERIRSRGNVHRTFIGFSLHGDVPSPGTVLEADAKAVGELTSVAGDEVGGQRLALGYVRREALERGLPLFYAGGRAEPRAVAAAS